MNLVLFLGIRDTSRGSRCYQTQEMEKTFFMLMFFIYAYWPFWTRMSENQNSLLWKIIQIYFPKRIRFQSHSYNIYALNWRRRNFCFKTPVFVCVVLYNGCWHSGANEHFPVMDSWKLIFSKCILLWAQVLIVKVGWQRVFLCFYNLRCSQQSQSLSFLIIVMVLRE